MQSDQLPINDNIAGKAKILRALLGLYSFWLMVWV